MSKCRCIVFHPQSEIMREEIRTRIKAAKKRDDTSYIALWEAQLQECQS